MSKSIDQRVLEMQFDNKQFESNVRTSINTLDSLKKSLDLSSSVNSLEHLRDASGSFSLDGISSAVENISDKFSTFGVFTMEVFRRISNAAIDCGTKMISALTIDPAKAGFEEYELKMGSVQTIMASTGESLDTVNKYLQELNEYSDQTIYSFSDMTQNIGKFTNAGVKLEDAVLAIKGISNEAAVSGANANEASRAMYNFAQALSAGHVKLIDWKSIENANMATVEFKNQLIETALSVGTLVKEGDMFRTTTKNAKGDVSDLFDATKGFNEALNNQWMTTDVLVQTLSKYASESTEIGQKAFASATEIKTFTMMMETLKESAQSGWATSMELIVGDFEEAKVLWTTIGGELGKMIESSADSRNELIAGWADGGGRDAIIAGFGNAWKTVLEIIGPVREYFRDIFPKVEAEKLIELSNNFKKFTENLMANETIVDGLKNTFKGFFAIFGIAKQVFTALINTIKPVFGVFDGLGETIFSTTGSIGEWLVNLNATLEETAFFENMFTNIADKIKNIFTSVKTAITNVISSVKGFGDSVKENVQIPGANLILTFCDTLHRRLSDAAGSVEGFKNIVRNAFTAIIEWFETSGLATIFGGLLIIMKSVWDGVIIIGEGLAGAFKTICDSISTALSNADFEAGFDILNSGLFAAILIGIKKFVDGLKSPLKDIGSFTEGITDILGSVKGCFEEWQASLKAGTLLKIAGAIAILAAALVVLSLIDSEKLALSLTVVVGMLVELMFALNTFSIIAKGSNGNLTKLTTSMIGISVAVLIMSVAMKSLADLEWEDIGQGLLGLAGMTAILVAATQLLSKNEGRLIKGAAGLVVFAVALRVLVGAVRDLGEIDTLNLIKGLTGVGILMTELAMFIQAAKMGKLSITTAAGILVLAFAVKEFSQTVAIFGGMDTSQLIQGMQAMGVLLAELAIFIKLSSGAKGMVTAATGLLILGAAMNIFANAVGHLGVLPIEQLIAGLAGMAVILTSLTLAMNLLPKNMISLGLGLLAVSSSLVIMANAISTMGGLSWEQLKIGLIALSVGLTAVVVATNLMNGALGGAAALLVVAGAIGLLTPSLTILSKLSWDEIGRGLVMLGGSLAILSAAGALAMVIAPGLLALGASLALIGLGAAGVGAGLLAAGVGLAALGAGFTTLAALGATGAAAIVAGLSVIILGIVGLVPAVVAKIGEAIVTFCDAIIAAIPAIIKVIVVVVESLVKAVVTTIPTVMEGFATLLTGILEVIVNFIPKLTEGGLQIILAILNGISNNIMAITEAAIDIVVKFLAAIATKIPEVVQAGFDILLSFINGMTDAINNNVGLVVEAFNGLILAIINAAITCLKGSVDLFKTVGNTIMNSGLVRGIKDKLGDVVNVAKEIVSKATTTLKNKLNDFKSVGKEVVNGFIKGIQDKFSDAASIAKQLGEKILKSIKSTLGIASPSKEFIDVGKWSVMGLANGLVKFGGYVSSAAENLGTEAYNNIKNSFKGLGSVIPNNIDLDPVIRPTLDLSNVRSGASRLNAMFSQQQVAVAAAGFSSGQTIQNEQPSIAKMLNSINDRYTNAIVDAINNSSVPVNVNVTLSGDAAGVFKLVRNENDKFIKSTGYNPLAKKG